MKNLYQLPEMADAAISPSGATQPLITVDIVSDVMCPWCIIGWRKFEPVIAHFADRARFRVQWHPFELNPQMSPEGQEVRDHVMQKYGITAEQSRANSKKMDAIGRELGIAFNRGPTFRMANSFDAHRLLTWAGTLEEPDQASVTGVQTDLKMALFDAHFTANRDVSDHVVLVDVAASVGLDPVRAASILADNDFADQVRSEQAFWADNNVTGVPAFILNRQMMIPGAQDAPVFIRVIERKILAEN